MNVNRVLEVKSGQPVNTLQDFLYQAGDPAQKLPWSCV